MDTIRGLRSSVLRCGEVASVEQQGCKFHDLSILLLSKSVWLSVALQKNLVPFLNTVK